MVEIKERIYYADLGGTFDKGKYACVCRICNSGCVFGLLANKDEFPAHLECMKKKAEETTHG